MGDLGPFDRWRLPPLNSLEDIKRSLVEFQRLYENTLYVLEQFEGTGGGAADLLLSQYNPDRPRAANTFAEEYTGNTHALTWRWQNQNDASETLEMDTAFIVQQTASATTSFNTRWFTGAAPGTSFALTAKAIGNIDLTSQGFGISVLAVGTEGSPTLIESLLFFGISSTQQFASRTSYTSASTVHGASPVHRGAEADEGLYPMWLQMRYDAATLGLSAYTSIDGYKWDKIGDTVVLAAHPTSSHGIFVNRGTGGAGNGVRFFYVRERTDPAGLAGEVGAGPP